MIESKEDTLLKSLLKFYEQPDDLSTLTEILKNKSGLSLRTLDWLVTNYSKKRNVTYMYNNKFINVYLEYKACLKAYSKRLFDPFQRRQRIHITDSEGHPLQSTIGQLNFFRFAISSGVIQYARDHMDTIEQDMMDSIKYRSSQLKRTELSKAAIKSATSTDIKVTVRFT